MQYLARMSIKIGVVVGILLTTGAPGKGAQTDDWVKADQEYWKFKVASEGIFKLEFQDLQEASSSDLTTLDPAYFKLYRLGKKKPLHLETGNDGTFNQGDFISFYAQPNDGTLDTGLYLQPSLIPTKRQSLYTDSAVYFLTYDEGSKGRRFKAYTNTNYQQYPEQTYFMDTAIRVFQEAYNAGNQRNNNTNTLELSYYTAGEGWTSNNVVHWTSKDWDVQVPGFQKGISEAPEPSVEIKLHGSTKCDSGGGFNPKYHHKTRIEVDNRRIGDFLYNGYQSKVVRSNVPWINGPSVNFDLFNRGVLDYNLKCDFSRISYIGIAYPRKINASLTLSFHVPQKGSPVKVTFDQFQGNQAVIYDPVAGQRIEAEVIQGEAKAIIPPQSQGHRLYLTARQALQQVNPRRASFGNVKGLISSKPDYLIITHPKLKSSAEAYKQFREQASNLSVDIAYIDNLFNRYSYGQHHALGIRYFLKDLVNNQAAPEYLLLLGKGLQPQKLRKGNLIRTDLVPTIGQPPTDNLFVTNLKNTGRPLSLAFPVGRIPASNNQEVNNYLRKVKAYHQALKNGKPGLGRAWRKQFLHLSGGETKQESKRFKRYLADYAEIARNSPYGAQVDVISKSKSIPVDKSQKDFVIKAINEGRSLVTYFGHGASEILEVDIGNPSDYRQEKGNYPIFLFSGCIIGNSYTQGRSLPEQFLVNNPENGGIAWMAESSFSFESYLDRYTLNFYKALTGANYGDRLGQIFRGAAQKMRLTNGARDYINEMQIIQKTFHGDPALRIFAPRNPDYTTSRSIIDISPERPNASLDSITLQIGVQNIGKAVSQDSVRVTVTQSLSNLNKITYGPRKYPAPANKDTLNFPIRVNPETFKGNNKFTIALTNTPAYEESDTTNNQATIETFIPSSSITPLAPRQYGIVQSRNPTLKVQANNLRLREASYQFQVDTTPDFGSPALQTSPVFQGSQFGAWKPELFNKDSMVYYWRAKKVLPDETSWVQRSFMYINNSPSGWAQGHYDQLKRSKTQNLTFLDAPARRLEFDREAFGRYNIQTTGATRGEANRGEYAIRFEGPRLFFGGARQGMYILAINPNKPNRLNYPSPYNKFSNVATKDGTPKDTTSGVFQFDWVKSNGNIDTAVVEDFISHVKDSIPSGYKVLAFTTRKHLIPQLPNGFYKAMESLGSGIIRNVEAKWPYILIGEKGSNPGEASEKTADTTQPLKPGQQLIKASKTIFSLQKSGKVTSQLIGPSANWEDAFLKTKSLEAASVDSNTFDVIGVTPQGNQSVIKRGLQPGAHSLSQVNAADYPYLRLRANLSDRTTLTPSQIATWLVHFDYLPEGSIIPQTAYTFHNDTLQQGEKLRLSLAYQNISAYPMDSVKVTMAIINRENEAVIKNSRLHKPLSAGDTLMMADTISTDQLAGNYRLQIKVNPNKAQPEQYLFNNFWEERFVVKPDLTKPVLDVTFNNRYIENNAILNPQPVIRIKARDDNNFYLMDDTSRIRVALTYPSGRRVPLTYEEDLTFKPANSAKNNSAKVIYRPASPLPEGQFTLSVTATDASGNNSGNTSYQKDFRIVKTAAVVNFRASPNPFSKRTRFLFTLKGKEVPETMRIRIFTPTGALVKVISHDDLAPLNLGENQTTFLWDGRTTNGRKASSGIYFYQVEAYIDGTPVPFRSQAPVEAGNDRIGKLILTR